MTERLDPYELYADDDWDVTIAAPRVTTPRKNAPSPLDSATGSGLDRTDRAA